MVQSVRVLPGVVLGVGLLAGCTGSAAPAATDTSSAPSSGIEPTIASTSLEERVVAELEIPNGDTMVEAAGSVWVKTDDGRLVGVHAATGAQVGDLRLDTTTDPSRYCHGLGSDGASIWACSAGNDAIGLVRVDPATRSVVASVAVEKIFDQLELVVADGRVWLLTGDGSELVGIDVETVEVDAPIPLPTRCSQLATDGAAVFASCPTADQVVRVDPGTGAVDGTADVEEPTAIAATGDDLWVGSKGSLVRLDAQSLDEVAVVSTVGPGRDGDLAADESGVWVRRADGFLFRVDGEDPGAVEQIVAEMGGGSVLVTDGAVWATAFDEGMLYRLSPE